MSQDNPIVIPIPFHGDTITAIETVNSVMVAVKPICERLGLAWQPQHRKLIGNPRWGVINMVIPSTGGMQETTCIPISKVFGWLAQIELKRVKPELRERLALYQDEADAVLDRHFRLRNEAKDDEIAHLRWMLARSHAQLLAGIQKWAQFKVMLDEGMWIDTIARRLNWTLDRAEDEKRVLEDCGLQAPEEPRLATTDGFMRELRRLRAENRNLQAEISGRALRDVMPASEDEDQPSLFGED